MFIPLPSMVSDPVASGLVAIVGVVIIRGTRP